MFRKKPLTADEFEQRLAALGPPVEPDEIDLAMMADAEAINDGTTISLEDFEKEMGDYNGKILVRIPRSLHRKLVETARAEGVSLNQYALHLLSRG